MLVSLFSDASLCNLKRVGGWAAWLKSDRGAIRTGAHFRTTINDITIAEAMAAANGLSYGLSIELIQAGDTVLIQSDNDGIMAVLEGTAERKVSAAVRRRRKLSWKELRRDARYHNAEIQLVSSVYRELVTKYDLTVRWRHVKGHRGKCDPRSAVNTFCDEVAKNHMRIARKRKIHPRDHSSMAAPAAGHPSELAATHLEKEMQCSS